MQNLFFTHRDYFNQQLGEVGGCALWLLQRWQVGALPGAKRQTPDRSFAGQLCFLEWRTPNHDHGFEFWLHCRDELLQHGSYHHGQINQLAVAFPAHDTRYKLTVNYLPRAENPPVNSD
jgi:hypothetical protein